ncbi:hypothetical protein K402DRAFT_394457 [Aulographum hederae CBS 113979]|uniref:Uncharacterized protein n=1 Tax=Aulographum hederae CBS 113979 TaxID=1176131 RepID=A0A6G1GY46_9PEZI|nr:hypothetical protein K402DRAFT_394457 [Aulographum hederae CBS 113979]
MIDNGIIFLGGRNRSISPLAPSPSRRITKKRNHPGCCQEIAVGNRQAWSCLAKRSATCNNVPSTFFHATRLENGAGGQILTVFVRWWAAATGGAWESTKTGRRNRVPDKTNWTNCLLADLGDAAATASQVGDPGRKMGEVDQTGVTGDSDRTLGRRRKRSS